MTLGSLFDGIAGFPLAAERQGIKTVWISEIEANCIEIAKRHFPDAADIELQFIKTLVRLSYDLNLQGMNYKAMSKHRYEVISRHITAIGSTLNGIIEAVKAGTWKPDK